MMCVFFVSVYTISSRNNASIFDCSSVSNRKMNLIGALGRSKFKIPSSFKKRREKQTKKLKKLRKKSSVNPYYIFITILSIGNIKLADLSLEQLNNRHVCNLHFKPTDFNNIETQQRLKQNVIPIKYDFTELPTNVGQYIPTP